VGDAIGEQSVRVLAWGGRLLIVGFAGGRIPQLPANRFLLKNASAIGVYWGEWKKNHPDLAEEVLQDLFRMYEAGRIKPIIGERFPLSEAPAALEALGGRKSVGKVVLIP
jgi:NADPH2:quinone reductase